MSLAQPPHLLTTFTADTCVHLAAAQSFRMSLSVKTCLISFLITASYQMASSVLIPISELQEPSDSRLFGSHTLVSKMVCREGIHRRALHILLIDPGYKTRHLDYYYHKALHTRKLRQKEPCMKSASRKRQSPDSDSNHLSLVCSHPL